MTAKGATGFLLLSILLVLVLPLGDGLQQNLAQFAGQTLVAALGLCLLLVLAAPGPVPSFDHRDLLMLLFLGVCLLSVAHADYRYAALLRFFTIAAGAVLYVAVRIGGEGRVADLRERLPGALVTSALLASVYALVHFRFEGTRAHGFFEDPNGLAAFANVGLAMAWPVSSEPRRLPHPEWLGRLAASVVLIATVVLTHSRGGLLALLLLLALLAFRHRRFWRLFLAGAVLTAAVILASPFRDKLLHPLQVDALAYQRIDIYYMDLRMAATDPSLGIGLGQFPWFAPRANFALPDEPVRYSKIALAAHSDPLQFLVELGIPGASIFALLMLCPVLALATTARAGLSLRAAAALAAFNLHGLFHHLLLTDGLFLTWCLLLALLPSPKPAPAREVPALPGRRAAALAALGVFVWAGAALVPFLAARQMESAMRAAPRLPQVQAAVQRALDLVPIHPYYHQAMAGLYVSWYQRSGDPEALARALLSLDTAIRYNPNDWTLYHRKASAYSIALEKGLATEEVVRSLREALRSELEFNPRSPVPLLTLARLDLREGRLDEAQGLLQEALDLEPNYLKAHDALRRIHAARGDLDRYDAQTRRIREIYSRYGHLAVEKNYREILSLSDEMKREFR